MCAHRPSHLRRGSDQSIGAVKKIGHEEMINSPKSHLRAQSASLHDRPSNPVHERCSNGQRPSRPASRPPFNISSSFSKVMGQRSIKQPWVRPIQIQPSIHRSRRTDPSRCRLNRPTDFRSMAAGEETKNLAAIEDPSPAALRSDPSGSNPQLAADGEQSIDSHGRVRSRRPIQRSAVSQDPDLGRNRTPPDQRHSTQAAGAGDWRRHRAAVTDEAPPIQTSNERATPPSIRPQPAAPSAGHNPCVASFHRTHRSADPSRVRLANISTIGPSARVRPSKAASSSNSHWARYLVGATGRQESMTQERSKINKKGYKNQSQRIQFFKQGTRLLTRPISAPDEGSGFLMTGIKTPEQRRAPEL
ncbi:hypothetical protein ACLOJK_015027 [Asimina triloba]